MKKLNILLIAIAFLTFSQQRGNTLLAQDTKGLKDYYQDYFVMGVAVSPRSLRGDEANLIKSQFNSLTAENVMKGAIIHPEEDKYNWEPADQIVEFAQANNMRMRGHTLVWHSQQPRWMFVNEKGDTVSKEVLLKRMEDHITNVVTRYKGKIYAWDVVNEAISDKKDEFLRKSPWLTIIGEEFIAKAFEYAHKADPDALLFYNDYNEIDPIKREKMYKLVSSLKKAGVPIHGVGLQGHWAINEPTRDQLDSTLTRFSESGLTLQVTELDISVYPKEHNRREVKPEDKDTSFSEQKEQQQRDAYQMCFELFRKHKASISSITFWNVSDRYSWLDNFPVRGRKDYPLLFDKDLNPKKVYWDVVKF